VLPGGRRAATVGRVARLTHLNPDGVPSNPAFSQAVVVSDAARTVYVGGQNGVGPDGAIAVGIRAQTVQALRNLEIVLAAAGTTLARVVKWNVNVVAGASLADAVAGFADVWDRRAEPPAITVAVVAALANPQFDVEIDAVAIAGEEE
jgi:enamine deaminase RidA (YjgF/YER057c/UK114 family)